ncbi:MAG: hypothetical protein ACSLFR_10750 [Solirubrobacteraceae bacterium]
MDVTEDPQRFEAASLAALFGAVLLLVSPFLTWFDPGGSAWTLFELLDLVLVGIALYIGVTATTRLLDVDRGADPRGVPIAGGVALAAVLATMLEPPPVALDASTGFGAWLALLGSVIILAAGLLDLARVSVTVSVGAREDDEQTDAPVRTERGPQTWTPPAPAPAPASTEAPPSRTPSLLRPNDPPPTDQVPEGD